MKRGELLLGDRVLQSLAEALPQLVQPLAVTLIFGLLFSPFLILFFVPSLVGIGSDLRRGFGRLSKPVPAAG